MEERVVAENRQSTSDIVAQAPTTNPSPSSPVGSSSSTFAQGANLATIISLLSLSVSVAVAYFSNFRGANIKLSFGRNIILFSVPNSILTGTSNNPVEAGVGFNIPITFYNWSPQGGTVQKIRLVIKRQGSKDYYTMTWTTFARIGSGGVVEDEDLAQPIPVEGRSSVNKIIRFYWTPEEGEKSFEVKPSDYELRIYGWTDGTKKPDLEYSTSFTIKEKTHYEKYKESVAKNASSSIWIPLDENEKPNQVLYENDIKQLYSTKK